MKSYIFSAVLFSVILLAGSCKSKPETEEKGSDTYYTCPMHPTVIRDAPGACPVCNMSLIKVKKSNSAPKKQPSNIVTLDKRQQKLAGIETDTIKFRTIFPQSTILGTVAIDEQLVRTISSRVKGRIDQLFTKTTGIFLQKGSPLYSIYSEQLLADEKEFLSLKDNTKVKNETQKLLEDMRAASRKKLRLWGLSEKQISALETRSKSSPLITFSSPETGYVTEVNITEGSYVGEGSPLMKITSLKQVWVEAQVYANEISNELKNKSFLIFSDNNPDETFNGTLVYNNPVIEQGRRIHLLRIRVENSKGKLIPGMMVSVSPQKTAQPVLAIPKSALLLEKMKTVWVKTKENTFEQRMIKTGTENKTWVEINTGLKAGELIVTNGAYLISSELILKSGAMKGHSH